MIIGLALPWAIRLSRITLAAPTPIWSGDLIVVASGRRPEAPIFAIRGGAAGDITKGGAVAWSKTQRGPYMPTPLFYHGLLYVLGNAGIFDCYDFKTGQDLSWEDGDVFVVMEGAHFELLKKNAMDEPIMSTLAISGGALIVRTQYHLWEIRGK